MALTPAEARKLKRERDVPLITAAEARIDNMLARGERRFALGQFKDVILELCQLYREKGWKIKLESDQRDGVTWMEFHE